MQEDPAYQNTGSHLLWRIVFFNYHIAFRTCYYHPVSQIASGIFLKDRSPASGTYIIFLEVVMVELRSALKPVKHLLHMLEIPLLRRIPIIIFHCLGYTTPNISCMLVGFLCYFLIIRDVLGSIVKISQIASMRLGNITLNCAHEILSHDIFHDIHACSADIVAFIMLIVLKLATNSTGFHELTPDYLTALGFRASRVNIIGKRLRTAIRSPSLILPLS